MIHDESKFITFYSHQFTVQCLRGNNRFYQHFMQKTVKQITGVMI